MKKTCTNCKTYEIHRGSYCKDCARIKTIERQQRFKCACVAYKSTENGEVYGTCSSCKKQFEDAQLCIRHRLKDPQNIKISKLTGAVPLRNRVIEELDKCDLICHNCERKIYRSRSPAKPLKKKAIEYLGGECNKCGADEPSSALEFHHNDANMKTLQLGDRGLKSWDSILPDLEVCSIVCANCHSKHHADEKAEERKLFLEKAFTISKEGV